tara:strand:+ start:263 stop:1567 length:1305 start_codon:yes stop_codon:yes gene_type:complete
MADSKTTGYSSTTRKISIEGTVGAEFELHIKQGSNYYNWDTNVFVPTEKILKFQKIPTSGTYVIKYVVPTVTTDTSYDFYIRAHPGTTLNVPTTHEQKIGTLFQKGEKTATFTATEHSTLVVQNSGSAGTDLTGGTLTNNYTTLTQTGTITEASSLFVYCHSVPSWNVNDGGSWTNSNYVGAEVESVLSSEEVMLKKNQGTNVASGYSVTGDNIADQITVSAISGDKVTLSAGQDLKPDQKLVFSKSEWKIGPLSATIADTSGTNSISMTTTHNVEKIGIANVTCVLDVDDHFSVKPNAFPVNGIQCPKNGTVDIFPRADCTNYLNKPEDNDRNVASKTFKTHSVPTASSTATRPTGKYDDDGEEIYETLEYAGSVNVSAGSAMGSAGVSEVTYTAHSGMIEGDKDFFFYKTVDAQSSPVTSSLTQGKISITIV